MTRGRGAPRRLLMTADAVGGVWTYCLDLCRGLTARGAEVTLATMGPRPSRAQRMAAARIRGLTLRQSDFALEWADDPWTDVDRAGDWLLALEREVAPDVVHLNGYAHATLPFVAPTVVVAHSCVLSWWRAVLREEAPPRYQIYWDRVRAGLHAAGGVVAPTAALAAELGRLYEPGRDVAVIPNGTSVPEVRGVPDKGALVLAAGRLWDPAKNLSVLDQAARRVPWPIAVAGEDRGAGVSRIELLGRLSHCALVEQMTRAAIFAHPARYEPFGLAPLEAARRGCALVLGDIPTLREVWGDAARYVEPDDPEQLALTLRELCIDDRARRRLAEAAIERARRYPLDRQIAAYGSLYTDLAAGDGLHHSPQEMR